MRLRQAVIMEGVMDVTEALEAVVRESNSEQAKAYARAALEQGGSSNNLLVQTDRLPGALIVLHEKTGKPMIGHEMRVQLLYVLNNLHYWRGERAKEVKEVLKQATTV